MEMNVKSVRNSDHEETNQNLLRLEEKNRIIFKMFKICGIFLIKWDPTGGIYHVRRLQFIFFYILWFVWPLIGLGIAVYGKELFNFEDNTSSSDDVNASVSILFFAVIPAVMTYSLNLVTRFLPEALANIASLSEFDVGFKTPLTIHPIQRIWRLILVKNNAQQCIQQDKLVFILPIITVISSLGAFSTAWTFGILNIVSWNALWAEWPLFTMLMTYLTFPVITNLFCIVFIEWFLTANEALESAFKNHYQLLKKYLEIQENKPESPNHTSNDSESSGISQCGAEDTLNSAYLLHLQDYIDKLQATFYCLSEGFLKYITGTNYLVYLVVSVFSTVKLFAGYEQIFFMIPLGISITHLALSCYKANCLTDAHERILISLKRILQLGRNQPNVTPWDEINKMRENLQEVPPQVAIFGGYRVGNGLFITALGFILTYAVLASDVISLQMQLHSYNKTISGYLNL